jgi:hypothetical protein
VSASIATIADCEHRLLAMRNDHRRFAALELPEHGDEEAALVEPLGDRASVARELGSVAGLGDARDRGEPLVSDRRLMRRGLRHGACLPRVLLDW